MSEEKSKWRAIGSDPISAEAPSGESVRYDPEFEQLQAEMQKLENLSGESVDWKKVTALSEAILKNKSKDLLVCGYLVLGLLETEGLSGLSNGLTCLEGLIADHWSSLFPTAKRMRARINALNWISEKTGAVISRTEPDQVEMLSACNERVETLEALLQEKLGPEDQGLTDLHRPIREQLSRISAVMTQPAEVAAEQRATVESRPVAIATAAPLDKLETDEDVKRAMKDSFSALKKIGSFTRNKDLTKPLPFRLIRFITWCEIDSPPAAENGKSRVPPPPKQLRDRFQTLMQQSSWKELVSQVEARVAEFPFWLDLHRMSETGLSGLGSDYMKARQAVKSEVTAVLERLPDLVDFQFSDGTPFADESTQEWISSQILPASDAESGKTPTPDNDTDSLDEIRQQSRQLLGEGKLNAALGFVQEAAKSCPAQRRKFLIHLELINLCIESGQIKAALAHLETLDDQVRRFSLDIWEPQLASQVLQLYWHTLNKALRESKKPAPELSQLADSVYGRLCRLDVLAGLDTTKRN